MYSIQKPTLSDIEEMRALVSVEVERGVILERSIDEMANAIRSYHIARENPSEQNKKGKIIGFCALYVYSSTLGELRSLIVDEKHRGKGIASTLIESVKKEAKELGLNEILVLTYKEKLFQKLGFVIIDKALPNHKIWADCIKCKHFPICDEVALIVKV
ncbi:N-acetyltransferase [Helicobacter himalayensis]|uniref:N-acetyltransferase n=1 Tax=Helicobacter himalayensis TaxID=1591088 RepID=UPI000835C69C|nr:N-acetyltransferase [Helicobacter himalayensis]